MGRSTSSGRRIAGRLALLALIAAGLAGVRAATDPSVMITAEVPRAALDVLATSWEPDGGTDRLGPTWLPPLDLVLPASLGPDLATGKRLKAVDPHDGNRMLDLEIVDWLAVEAPQTSGMRSEPPVVIVLARAVEDGRPAQRPLLRFVLTLEAAPSVPAAAARQNSL